MTCYLHTLEVASGFDVLGDLRTFESKESRGSYNLLLLVLWFDVVGILYHFVLCLCDFLVIYKCIFLYL